MASKFEALLRELLVAIAEPASPLQRAKICGAVCELCDDDAFMQGELPAQNWETLREHCMHPGASWFFDNRHSARTLLEECLPGIPPPKPTRKYCMVPPNGIRWKGEREAPPIVWKLMDVLMQSPEWTISSDRAETEVWGGETSQKNIANTATKVNNVLSRIRFPLRVSCKAGYIRLA